MLEQDSEPGEPLDPRVEIVALEIDGGRRADRLFRVRLDRQGRAAEGLEAGVLVFRAVDDLLQSKLRVEVDGLGVVLDGQRDLIEPRAGTDVEADVGRSDRARPFPRSGAA